MSGKLLLLAFFALILQIGASSQERSMEIDVGLDQAASLSRSVGYKCTKMACKFLESECSKSLRGIRMGRNQKLLRGLCRRISGKVCVKTVKMCEK